MVPIGRLTSNEATDASHSLDSRSGRRAKRLAGRRLRASAGGLAFKSPRLSSARLVIRRGCFKKQPPAFRVGYFVPTFVIARRNVAVATLLVMARSLRMTLERRKTAGLDDKLTTASELEKLMSEVMCYERKWLKRNLSRHTMRHHSTPRITVDNRPRPQPLAASLSARSEESMRRCARIRSSTDPE
jgi:hypothetical protein